MVTNVPRSQADIFPFSLAEGTAWGYARVRLDCGGASSLTNTIGGRIISQIQTVREHLPDSYIVYISESQSLCWCWGYESKYWP